MKSRAPWESVAVLVLLTLAGFTHAAVKDAAELLPAQTLACVEVRQPERLSREIAVLLKGSKLEEMPAVMARFREKLGNGNQYWIYSIYAAESLLVSPEMINECGRIQGAVIALTGVTKEGPEFVGVVMAGDSNLPTFYLRAMLTANFNVRAVAEVEGVQIYRERRQKFNPALAGAGAVPMPPQWEDYGSFMALLPSTIVLGSSAESVKDVVRRFKGKSAEPSLASVAAYKEAVKQRDKPGLYAYADLAALAGRLDELGKNLGLFEQQWNVIKAAINPKAALSITASLTLQNGVLELKSRLDLDPKQSSPAADLLAAKAAPLDVLYFTPRDGMLTVNLNLNDGEKRWGKLMDLIAGLNLPRGTNRTSEREELHKLEDRVKLNIAKDILGKLTSAAVTLDPVAIMQPDGRIASLLVLHATDPSAAESLESQGLPKLLGLASGKTPARINEEGEGNVSTVATGDLEPILHAKNLYIGRSGTFVIVGVDRKDVAAALAAGAKKEGLLGEEKTAATLNGMEDSALLAVFSLAKGIVVLAKQMEQPPTLMAAPAIAGPGIAAPAPRPAPKPADKPAGDPPVKLSARAEKTIADVTKAVEALPPTVLNISRKGDSLTLEIRQSGLKNTISRLIDLGIDSALDRIVEQQNPNGP